MSQNNILLNTLRGGHTVTRATGFALGIMNLTARIADLRRRGHTIVAEKKKDGSGKQYFSFKLVH